MKRTLLDLTQDVLSAMESDEVNSIADTVEAQQVVRVIRRAYFDIIDRLALPHQKSVYNLLASTDSDKPTLMTLPDGYNTLEWLRYDKQTVATPRVTFEFVYPLSFVEFSNMMYNLSTDDDDVFSFSHTVGSNLITFLGKDSHSPTYYTTFDDGTIIFDSYDSDVDTTLQSSKTLAYGVENVAWSNSDVFVPDLDDSQFPLLLNEALSMAFAEMKQTQHAKAEQSAHRQWVVQQKKKEKIKTLSEFDKLPNYGRR